MIRRGVMLMALLLGACAQPPSAAPPPVTVTSLPVPAPTTTAYAGPSLIDHVQWTSNSKGRTLQVYPTDAGRTASGVPARVAGWQEVVRAAPAADTASMRDQFYCHWDFARIVEPNKPSWNLEAWRPDVGYAATVQAQCNPGGPE